MLPPESFPGGIIETRVVDGQAQHTYLLKDADDNWQEVAFDLWAAAKLKHEREQEAQRKTSGSSPT